MNGSISLSIISRLRICGHLRFNPHHQYSIRHPQCLSFLLLLIYIISRFFIVPNVYAEGEFVTTYRSYQSAVRSGKTFFSKKDYEKAIAHYSKAIKLSPYEVPLYYDRGVALYKAGRAEEAAVDFDKVLVMDSRRYQANVYRGLCQEKKGNYIEALKDYTSALGMNPKDAGVHNNLAWLYATADDEKVQDNAKALEHAKKAVEISSEKNAEILDTLARAYFINGMVREAVEAEKKAVALGPGNKEFMTNLKIYVQGGDAVSSERLQEMREKGKD